VRLAGRVRPLRAGGRAPAGGGRGLRPAAEALGRGADVRLAGPLPAAERGPGADGGGGRGHDPTGAEPYDAQPLAPEGTGFRVSMPQKRLIMPLWDRLSETVP